MSVHGIEPLMSGVWETALFQGRWNEVDRRGTDVTDKSTGERLAQLILAEPADLSVSAQLAVKAQADWTAWPHDERSRVFRKAADLILLHQEEAARWIMRETGGIKAKAEMELRSARLALEQAASMLVEPQGLVFPSPSCRLSYAQRIPHGVVGVIAPFNFPLTLAMRAVAPALATGNAVILKPDPQTAVCGGLMIAKLFELAGLPPGVLHILPGGAEVGKALCTDPNVKMVTFTGSTSVGRQVAALCGQHLKKVSLELGGKNTLVVLDDAELDAAVDCAASGAWLHQGQICMATGRILVHEKIVGVFVDKLVEKARALKVGDPTDEGIMLGPLINEKQLANIDRLVKETLLSGARLRIGGRVEGRFYPATVLDGVLPGMPGFEQEVFGPVALVTTFKSDEEAIALANQTEYGLSAAVLSRSVGRALAIGRQLRTGLLHINDQTVAGDPRVPFGGVGASGNGGRIGGPANWDEFTQWRWITIQEKPPSYIF